MHKYYFMQKAVKQLTVFGAITGIAGILIYLMIVFVKLPSPIVFLLAILFPLCLLIFFYSLKEYTAFRSENLFNRLAFLFALMACQTLALMLAIQIGVDAGLEKQSALYKHQSFASMLRLIDLGLDVAWDVLISMSMLFWTLALWKINELKWWGLVNGLLGAGLLILNLLTFPVPPADAGLFDLGPVISLFWMLWQLRMLKIGIGLKQDTAR